jgi:hypothetical protein
LNSDRGRNEEVTVDSGRGQGRCEARPRWWFNAGGDAVSKLEFRFFDDGGELR